MKKKKTGTAARALCILLVLLTAAGCAALSSCSSSGGSTGKTENTTAAPVTEPPVTTEAVILPEVTEANYDGYDFHILFATRRINTPNDFETDDNSTVTGQAVYLRNERMKEKYGVIISDETDLGESHQGYSKLVREYISGGTTYDMGVINTYTVAPLTSGGYLYDLSEVPHLDLTKPWWDQTIYRDLLIEDSIYFMSGDISTAVDDFVYCIVFNKKLYAERVGDVADMYQTVTDGKWTLDKLNEIGATIYDDLNTNGLKDSADRYGIMTWNDELLVSMQAAGERIAKVNADGQMELTLYNDKTNDISQKFMTMEQSQYCYNFQKITDGGSWPKMFTNDQVLYFMSLFNEVQRFRDMQSDYGIIPNPKYDETQENYYCSLSAGLASFICVPGIQEDVARTGAIIELLGYEAQDTIRPAYYEKKLVGLYVRDDDSAAMLDLIYGNKFVDVGHYFTVGKLNVELYNLANTGNISGFAAMYERTLPVVQQAVKTVNEALARLKKTY